MYRPLSFNTALALLLAAVALAGCASTQPSTHASAAVPLLGTVAVNVDGAVPLAAASDQLLASRVRLGDSSPVRYNASYTVLSGDVLSRIGTNNPAAPTRLGGQRVGQQLDMRLLSLAGAPLSVGMSTEVTNQWTMHGQVREQRDRAGLNWSPRLASFDLQWVGPNMGRDPALALDCELQMSLRVPTVRGGSNGSQRLSLAGRDCRVRAGDGRYRDLDAQTLGVAYAWQQPQRETRLELSVIDPVWRDTTTPERDLDPAFELGLNHRVDRRAWTARTSVSLRQATVWDPEAGVPWYADAAARDTATWVGTETSVMRHLSMMSVSASWVHGADPMWFMPDVGQRNHRLVLGLDFSSGIRHLIPGAVPRLAMRWNWSEARNRSDHVARDNSLAVNMSVAW